MNYDIFFYSLKKKKKKIIYSFLIIKIIVLWTKIILYKNFPISFDHNSSNNYN